jgi:hypothetical protein
LWHTRFHPPISNQECQYQWTCLCKLNCHSFVIRLGVIWCFSSSSCCTSSRAVLLDAMLPTQSNNKKSCTVKVRSYQIVMTSTLDNASTHLDQPVGQPRSYSSITRARGIWRQTVMSMQPYDNVRTRPELVVLFNMTGAQIHLDYGLMIQGQTKVHLK